MAHVNRKLVLVDFDRTIFDLDLFYTEVWRTMGKIYGFNPDDALRNIRDFYYTPQNGYHGTYDFNRHIGLFVPNANLGTVVPPLKQALLGRQFLYDDFNELFEWQRAHDVRLLSYGEKAIQDFKLLFCPQIKGVPVDIILTPKPLFIAKNFAGREGVLIDDKIESGLPQGIRQIRILRDGSVENKPKSDMIVVNSLKQANQYL